MKFTSIDDIKHACSESIRMLNPHIFGEIKSGNEHSIVASNAVCLHCGKTYFIKYQSVSKRRKYCSIKCAYASKERVAHIKKKYRGTSTCKKCGIEFDIKTNSGKAKYCSQECARSDIGSITLARNRAVIPATKILTKQCESCGKDYKSQESAARKYCSIKCSGKVAPLKTRAAHELSGFYKSSKPYSRAKYGWRNVGDKNVFFRSSWEANYGRYLEFLKNKGQITEWEHEPETFWFHSIKRGVRSYLPDFRVTTNDGSVEYHEVKGWMDKRSATKIKRMAKYYPDTKLVVRDAKWFKCNTTILKNIIPCWEAGVKI